MSTKIYNAYEFKGDLDELMSMLGRVKKRVWTDALVGLVADLDDGVKFGWLTYSEALKKAMRSSEYYIVEKGLGCVKNMSCSAVVYPYKKRLFVQFFGLPRDLKLGSKKLVDYHYQNQSDRWYDFDKRAKDKVWYRAQAKNYREREKTWEAIFSQSWRPSSAGLVFEFASESDAIELSLKVFERIHGHKMDGSKYECTLCRAEVANEAKS